MKLMPKKNSFISHRHYFVRHSIGTKRRNIYLYLQQQPARNQQNDL